jgi:hypothetical protein
MKSARTVQIRLDGLACSPLRAGNLVDRQFLNVAQNHSFAAGSSLLPIMRREMIQRVSRIASCASSVFVQEIWA